MVKRKTTRRKTTRKPTRRTKRKVGRGVGTRTVKVRKQRGRSNAKKDKRLKAHAAGKRVTKWGTTYWETRKNRSDAGGKKAKRGTKKAI